MKKQLAIIVHTLIICVCASLAKLAGLNQATVDTLAIVSALALSIFLMVKVGGKVLWK